MSDFFHWFSMGGYAFYVWTAYAIAGILLLVSLVSVGLKKKKIDSLLQQWFKKSL